MKFKIVLFVLIAINGRSTITTDSIRGVSKFDEPNDQKHLNLKFPDNLRSELNENNGDCIPPAEKNKLIELNQRGHIKQLQTSESHNLISLSSHAEYPAEVEANTNESKANSIQASQFIDSSITKERANNFSSKVKLPAQSLGRIDTNLSDVYRIRNLQSPNPVETENLKDKPLHGIIDLKKQRRLTKNSEKQEYLGDNHMLKSRKKLHNTLHKNFEPKQNSNFRKLHSIHLNERKKSSNSLVVNDLIHEGSLEDLNHVRKTLQNEKIISSKQADGLAEQKNDSIESPNRNLVLSIKYIRKSQAKKKKISITHITTLPPKKKSISKIKLSEEIDKAKKESLEKGDSLIKGQIEKNEEFETLKTLLGKSCIPIDVPDSSIIIPPCIQGFIKEIYHKELLCSIEEHEEVKDSQTPEAPSKFYSLPDKHITISRKISPHLTLEHIANRVKLLQALGDNEIFLGMKDNQCYIKKTGINSAAVVYLQRYTYQSLSQYFSVGPFLFTSLPHNSLQPIWKISMMRQVSYKIETIRNMCLAFSESLVNSLVLENTLNFVLRPDAGLCKIKNCEFISGEYTPLKKSDKPKPKPLAASQESKADLGNFIYEPLDQFPTYTHIPPDNKLIETAINSECSSGDVYNSFTELYSIFPSFFKYMKYFPSMDIEKFNKVKALTYEIWEENAESNVESYRSSAFNRFSTKEANDKKDEIDVEWKKLTNIIPKKNLNQFDLTTDATTGSIEEVDRHLNNEEEYTKQEKFYYEQFRKSEFDTILVHLKLARDQPEEAEQELRKI
jgi:hypothetical protein